MDYIKKPVKVQAILWEGGEYECLNEFCGKNWARADAVDEFGPDDKENVVVWNTMEKQYLNLPVGFWLIRGVRGEFYPCEPNIFKETYEAAPITTNT